MKITMKILQRRKMMKHRTKISEMPKMIFIIMTIPTMKITMKILRRKKVMTIMTNISEIPMRIFIIASL
jgi:hypothetical protein